MFIFLNCATTQLRLVRYCVLAILSNVLSSLLRYYVTTLYVRHYCQCSLFSTALLPYYALLFVLAISSNVHIFLLPYYSMCLAILSTFFVLYCATTLLRYVFGNIVNVHISLQRYYPTTLCVRQYSQCSYFSTALLPYYAILYVFGNIFKYSWFSTALLPYYGYVFGNIVNVHVSLLRYYPTTLCV